MAWEWFSWFRRSPKEAGEAFFELNQGLIAERLASDIYKDLAEVAEANLETLARIAEFSRKFEGGDQVLAEAARGNREGLAALLATPPPLFPPDPEARREAMQLPSDGSTASQPMPA